MRMVSITHIFPTSTLLKTGLSSLLRSNASKYPVLNLMLLSIATDYLEYFQFNHQKGTLTQNSPFEEPVPPRREGQGDVKTTIMTRNSLIRCNSNLKHHARQLRQNSTFAEVLLWLNIKGKSYGYEFHRQVPINEFILDFYCHELQLAIEIDDSTHDFNYNRDEKRQKKLERLGIILVRFSDYDVKHNINDVLRTLEFVINEIEEKKKVSGDKITTSP